MKQFVFSRLSLIFAAVFILSIAIHSTLSFDVKTDVFFTLIDSPLKASYDLFDLGIADIDSNGAQDIFTLNHSAYQDILLSRESNGNGEFLFENILEESNLSQDHLFENLEDRYYEPDLDESGLYIYRQNFELHIQTRNFPLKDFNLLEVSLPISTSSNSDFTILMESKNIPLSNKVRSVLKFSSDSENAHLIIQNFPGLPHSFRFSETVPLDKIFIGHSKIQPESHEFDLMWRDRHSIAWNDYNSDGTLDAFIARGGIKGNIGLIPDDIQDEFFVSSTSQSFRDHGPEIGIEKGDCPARQSAWVDYNNDGLLDLYIACGRGKIGDSSNVNQLYEARSDSTFKEVAANVGLDLPGYGPFVWLDIDDDGDQDLLASQGKTMGMYFNEGNVFSQPSQDFFLEDTVVQLSISDFDNDRDFDVYVVTRSNSTNALLINRGDFFESSSPSLLGLSTQCLNGEWVDYNNDGLLDFYAVPEGIYEHRNNSSFVKTGLLSFTHLGRNTWSAVSSWFDFNNDGARDVIVAYRQTPSILQPSPSLVERFRNQILDKDTKRIWQSAFFRNDFQGNHWLQLKLLGKQGNSQAVGAKAYVVTKDGTQTSSVGISDSSLYSQGHFRMYFGVGQNEVIDLVKVIWPDQTISEISNVLVDRLLEIKHPDREVF